MNDHNKRFVKMKAVSLSTVTVLALASLLAFLPSGFDAAGGQFFEENEGTNIYYNVESERNKELKVIAPYDGSEYTGDVKIPSTVIHKGEEYAVVAIDNSAFGGSSGLVSVFIPDSVISISNSVFDQCTSLELVRLPDGMTTISNYMFNGCTSLKTIDLPKSVTSIGKYAFGGCTTLDTIIMSSGTNWESNAFSGCPETMAKIICDNEGVSAYQEDGKIIISYESEDMLHIYFLKYWTSKDGTEKTVQSSEHTWSIERGDDREFYVTFEIGYKIDLRTKSGEPRGTFEFMFGAAKSLGTAEYIVPCGQSVKIKAVPESKYDFKGWSGDINWDTAEVEFTPTKNMSLIAEFSLKDSSDNGNENGNDDESETPEPGSEGNKDHTFRNMSVITIAIVVIAILGAYLYLRRV